MKEDFFPFRTSALTGSEVSLVGGSAMKSLVSGCEPCRSRLWLESRWAAVTYSQAGVQFKDAAEDLQQYLFLVGSEKNWTWIKAQSLKRRTELMMVPR